MKVRFRSRRRSKRIVGIIVRVTLSIVIVASLLGIFAYRTLKNRKDVTIKAVSLEDTSAFSNEIIDNANLEEVESEPETEEQTMSLVVPKAPKLSSVENIDYYAILIKDFENLRNGDVETIVRYFGNSDAFDPEIISDRMAATTINFISDNYLDSGDREINVHICTLDYNLMSNDFNEIKESELSKIGEGIEFTEDQINKATELAKKVIAENLIENKYRVCYNIPVLIREGEVVIKESLKQALTGGWYSGIGVELVPVEHIKF